jgi:hypothetical protein
MYLGCTSLSEYHGTRNGSRRPPARSHRDRRCQKPRVGPVSHSPELLGVSQGGAGGYRMIELKESHYLRGRLSRGE